MISTRHFFVFPCLLSLAAGAQATASVVLEQVGPNEAAVARVVREADAGVLSKAVPVVVREGLPLSEATALLQRLVDAGATAGLSGARRTHTDDAPTPKVKMPHAGPWDLVVISIGERSRASMAALVRHWTGAPFTVLDTLPAKVLEKEGRETAEGLATALTNAGATVELVGAKGQRIVVKPPDTSWRVTLQQAGRDEAAAVSAVLACWGNGEPDDAKARLGSSPAIIIDAVTRPEADWCLARLVKAGAKAEVVRAK